MDAQGHEAFPQSYPATFDVAVVGAGVAGLSLARAAARAGLRTLLLESPAGANGRTNRDARWGAHGDATRDANGSTNGNAHGDANGGAVTCGGASALPAALLNPWRGRKGAAHPDDLRGLAAVWRWAEELAAEGRDPGAHRSGLLRLPTSARQAREWQARADAEASLAWWDAGALPAPYHAPFGALRVEDGGWLEPSRWRSALAASARDHGATLRGGCSVGRLVRTSGGTPAGGAADGGGPAGGASDGGAHDAATWTLTTHAGTALASARTVVVAVGAHKPPVASMDGVGVDWPSWERTRGEVVTLRGGPPFARPLAGPVYGASMGDRAWVGGGHRPADVPDPDAPDSLRAAFAHALPAFAQVPIDGVWSGVRAKRPDARPSVERVAQGLWTFGAFAGRGFLCAADEAERWVALRAGATSLSSS